MSRQKQSFSIGTEFGSKTVHTSTQIKLTIERKTLNYWNTIEIISWWTKQLDQDRWWGSNFHSLSIRLHLPAKVLWCAFHFREKLSRWFLHDFGTCMRMTLIVKLFKFFLWLLVSALGLRQPSVPLTVCNKADKKWIR